MGDMTRFVRGVPSGELPSRLYSVEGSIREVGQNSWGFEVGCRLGLSGRALQQHTASHRER
jgi:hypothetical protein